MLQLQCDSRYYYGCKKHICMNTFHSWDTSLCMEQYLVGVFCHCLLPCWKPSRMASSCTNVADFADKLSISLSVKIPLRRSRSFFDGKGGSVCEFWGSIDALRVWPIWNLNHLHLWIAAGSGHSLERDDSPTFLSSGVICRWLLRGRRSLNSSLTAHVSDSPNQVSSSSV